MHARIKCTPDQDARVLVFRYIGELNGSDVIESVLEQVAAIDEPWTYDCLFDLRRFDGAVLLTDLEVLARGWQSLAKGRDKGRVTAIVSNDPHVKARLPVTQSLFPQRTLDVFDSFDEGLDWLKAQRTAIDRAIAT